MQNEKMSILKMLEDGKITAGEAARLLEAATPPTGRPAKAGEGRPDRPQRDREPRHQGGGEAHHPGDGKAHHRGDGESRHPGNESRRPRPSPGGGERSFDGFADDLGKKFEGLAREWEPKLQRFAEAVVEKTADAADKLSRTISPPATEEQRRTGPKPSSPGPASAGTLTTFEKTVKPGHNELALKGKNANVRVKGYNGDKITLKVITKAKTSHPELDFMQLGERYVLHYSESDFEKVEVDALIPEALFDVVKISGNNGALDISSIQTGHLFVEFANGKAECRGISGDNLEIAHVNGPLVLLDISGQNGKMETTNGPVKASGMDIENLRLETTNSPMEILISGFKRHRSYTWMLETSNADMALNLPTGPDLGYYVKCHTSLGRIKNGLVNMDYSVNDNAHMEARSFRYDESPKQIKLSLETSNASISIN